jgi:hypothetical protein
VIDIVDFGFFVSGTKVLQGIFPVVIAEVFQAINEIFPEVHPATGFPRIHLPHTPS